MTKPSQELGDHQHDAEEAARSSRRGFLKLAVAAPAAAASVAVGAAPARAEDKPTSLGLRETEHVRKFYDSCRF